MTTGTVLGLNRSRLALVLAAIVVVILGTGLMTARAVAKPFQLDVTFNCITCNGVVPAPGPNKQLALKRISCYLSATAGAEFQRGTVQLRTNSGSPIFTQNFAIASQTPSGIILVNSEIDVTAIQTQFFTVGITFNTGTLIIKQCSVSGTLGPIS